MDETDVKLLIQRRGQVKANLTRFNSFLSSMNKLCQIDISQLKLRLGNIQNLYNEFNKIQDQLETANEEEMQSDERDKFENTYFAALATADTYITNFEKPLNTVTNKISQEPQQLISNTANIQVNLPAINLPSFDGSYEQWLPFYDTFMSLIHTNVKLDSNQKFHYLKSTLKGNAKEVIEALAVTSDNYTIAWDLLQERYENKRLIVQNHIKALFELPIVTKESADGLRTLLDGVLRNIRVLKSLKQPVDQWDSLLIHLITSKFDYHSKREWETKLKVNELPTMQDMTRFLTNRCQVLESLKNSKVQPQESKQNSTKHYSKTNENKQRTYSSSNVSISTYHCNLCKSKDHQIYSCDQFLDLSTDERYGKIKALKLCINCFRSNHQYSHCKARSCKRCNKKHNTLLHRTKYGNKIDEVNQSQQSSDNVELANISTHCVQKSQILLSTAVVACCNSNSYNKCINVRALLDSGSQSNFITEDTCKKLKLRLHPVAMPVVGINRTSMNIKFATYIEIKSRFNNFCTTLKCLVLPKITSPLPLTSIDISEFKIPENIQLADETFHMSNDIDLLIGAEIFWDILCVGQIQKQSMHPLLQETKFGWIVAGKYHNTGTNAVSCNLSTERLEDQLPKFWKVEELSPQQLLSKEEQQCEEHFLANYSRMETGRFIVKLPFKSNTLELGSSRESALKRFLQLEAKLNRNIKLKEEYSKFMKEYKELDHMRLQENVIDIANEHYYLPHHCVLKESSISTKLRVVFDASQNTSSGVSLNSNLMVGATVQQDLYSIVIRFRKHKYVITADIVKMYRQVLVDTTDQEYQKILWRNNPEDDLQTYRLRTVTYGTTAAPFLATRCLTELAKLERNNFPVEAKILEEDFYVDDVLTGANTERELIDIKGNLESLLQLGGFQLSKWCSNNVRILKHDNHSNDVSFVSKDQTIKVLGLVWNSSKDTFSYSVNVNQQVGACTKRTILSDIARLFDPLGLVGPVIVKSKIMMQRLWLMKANWDDSVDLQTYTEWNYYKQQLQHLNSLHIDRSIIQHEAFSQVQIHGFCDASEQAYGACLYARCTDMHGKHHIRLICSKSRVAPLKRVSLHRLELCGAVLLSNLAKRTITSLNMDISRVYLWTDSTIALGWIKSASNRWKTFVANRVAEIQTNTNLEDWEHIMSSDNPADIISRGAFPKQLMDSGLWWNGPPWLEKNIEDWPSSPMMSADPLPEQRKIVATVLTVVTQDLELIERYSDFSKLQRITAYMLRFIHNSRNPTKRQNGLLPIVELHEATIRLVKIAQAYFTEDITFLRLHKVIHPKSKLLSLHPFLDDSNVLRVGGRLKHAAIHYNKKHPILLPSRHALTTLLIRHEHNKQMHSGVQGTLAAVRDNYWPISGRTTVRNIIQKCLICSKVKPATSIQLMGDLPETRIQPARPFINCGLDYCGPIHLYEGSRRTKKLIKAYVAVFVCFATRAVHIELVGDLTSDAFIATLKRFLARRGKILNIYSDNATNFLGARHELSELPELFNTNSHKTKLNHILTQNNITWHTIPPRSPHFGGLWEAAIKSTKHHLKRVTTEQSYRFEEMYTMLTQIESILNSRPLIPLSNDPNDLTALTPAHFLIGDSLTHNLDPDLKELRINKLSRYQFIQQSVQHFWQRWSSEYLSSLQQRSKWKKEHPNMMPGMLVLLKEDNLPPLRWMMGRIVEVHPGKDNLVRAVTVKTRSAVSKEEQEDHSHGKLPYNGYSDEFLDRLEPNGNIPTGKGDIRYDWNNMSGHDRVKRQLSVSSDSKLLDDDIREETRVILRPKKPPRPKSEVLLNQGSDHRRMKRFSAFGGDSPYGKSEAYIKLEQLGEGSYATVYKGYSNLKNQVVALKEIRLQEEEGAPFTAIREASLLKELKHANIVTLHDIVHTHETLTFVFEYVHTDLSQYLERHSGGLDYRNVRLFLYQLLRGLAYCHKRRVLHRDVKPQNLLISEIGELKLADFGLARAKSVPSHTYSHEVVTLWYRPPDVLLGSTEYSTSLDMWGVGCIFVEMITGMAIFPGLRDTYDQLDKIFKVLGTPTEEDWPGVTRLPGYKLHKLGQYKLRKLGHVWTRLHDVSQGEAMASALLQLDPQNRLGAEEAMTHPYFNGLPKELLELPDDLSIFSMKDVHLYPEHYSAIK